MRIQITFDSDLHRTNTQSKTRWCKPCKKSIPNGRSSNGDSHSSVHIGGQFYRRNKYKADPRWARKCLFCKVSSNRSEDARKQFNGRVHAANSCKLF